MEEVGLEIGGGIGTHKGIEREWLYWYDQQIVSSHPKNCYYVIKDALGD